MERIGERLRRRREELGFTVDDVAEATKFRPEVIRAVEAGRTDVFPAEAYLKAFLRAYAAKMGLDAQEIVRDQTSEEERIHEALRGIKIRPLKETGMRRRLVLIAVIASAAVVAAVVVFRQLDFAGGEPEGASAPAESIEAGMLPGVSDSAGAGVEGGVEGSPAADSIRTPSPSGSDQGAEDVPGSEWDTGRTEGASEVPGSVKAAAERDRVESRWRSVEGSEDGVMLVNRRDASGELVGGGLVDLATEAEAVTGGQTGSESRRQAETASEVQTGSEPGGQGETEVVVQGRSGLEEAAAAREDGDAGSPGDTRPGTATASGDASEIEKTGEESCLEITALKGFYINIVSGGETLLDDHLSHGDRRTLCSSLPFVVVSLTDRYAVSMTLDGEPVDLAVSPGREIYNFTVPGYHETQ